MKITVLVAVGVSIATAVAVAVVVGMALGAVLNVAMPVAVAAAVAHYTIAVVNLTECLALFSVQIYLHDFFCVPSQSCPGQVLWHVVSEPWA